MKTTSDLHEAIQIRPAEFFTNLFASPEYDDIQVVYWHIFGDKVAEYLPPKLKLLVATFRTGFGKYITDIRQPLQDIDCLTEPDAAARTKAANRFFNLGASVKPSKPAAVRPAKAVPVAPSVSEVPVEEKASEQQPLTAARKSKLARTMLRRKWPTPK